MLELSHFVESDLEAIADWISEDSPSRALEFIGEIETEILLIAQRPLLYQVRRDLGEDLRLANVGHYVILFRVSGETVRIERVIFGGRDLLKLLSMQG